jgi:3-methyladenine DNA glycosylase AlkD
LKKDENLNHWDVASTLWELEHREYQYVAIDYLKKIPKKIYEKDDYQRIEELITTKSWWDRVDQIASNIAGPYFIFRIVPTFEIQSSLVGATARICGSIERVCSSIEIQRKD